MTDTDLPSDEFRDEKSPWQTATRWLVAVNVAVFVVDLLLLWTGHTRPMTKHGGELILQRVDATHFARIGQPVLTALGYFSVDKALVGGQVWRFFTYQFVHANIEHILLNMLGLIMVGPLVEERMGRWRYLLFYLVCGAAGPVAHIGLSELGLLQTDVFTPLIGASASIYGVLVAAAVLAPNEMVMLAIPPIDVRLRTFALALIALSLAAVTLHWQNAGGHAAHLGGAVTGWLLSRRFANRSIPRNDAEVPSPGTAGTR